MNGLLITSSSLQRLHEKKLHICTNVLKNIDSVDVEKYLSCVLMKYLVIITEGSSFIYYNRTCLKQNYWDRGVGIELKRGKVLH